jgi:ribosomal RNA assembly protein
MPIEEVAIPEDRKSILIGSDGRTKEEIEKRTGTKLSITDYVRIEGPVDGLLKAQNIVQAIGRGFSPKRAFRLLDEECQLEVITLKEEKENTRRRLFARVIGRDGGAKRNIERETGAMLSVYGKTISIVGKPGEIDAARQAVEALLEGKTHGYAYSLMEKERDES